MRSLALVTLLLLGACSPDVFVCRLDIECVGGHGEFGLCLENRCAFRDEACTGGYRWDDSAGSSLANMCADPSEVNGRLDAGMSGLPDAGAHD